MTAETDIYHEFVSVAPDGADPTKLRPSAYNDRHKGTGIGRINVMDAPYNCACDEVTDDTVGFALAAATGLPLHIPGPTLITDTIPVGSRLSWAGVRAERGAHALAFAVGEYTQSKIIFRPADPTKHLVRVSDTINVTQTIGPFEFKDLTIDIGDANGFELGLDDGSTVVDGAGQAYVHGVRFIRCALEATFANRASVAGVITRSGRRIVALTKAFETVFEDCSFYGCDVQIKTWGCDKPTFTRCRSQGSHLPLDFNGSGTFTVQHSIDGLQIEGWTFTPVRSLGVEVSCVDARFEQNDGTPTGSGRYALPGTATYTAPGTLVFSSTKTNILFPNLSLLEVTDGTFTHLVLVTAVSGATVTFDSSAMVAQLSTAAGACTAVRIHGYGPLHWSSFPATYTDIGPGASTDCPCFVYVVARGSMFITNAAADAGTYGAMNAAVVGNRLLEGSYLDSQMVFSACSPLVVADPDNPFVTTYPIRPIGGSNVGMRARMGPPVGELLTARRWSWTPKDTGTASNDSHKTPIVPVAGDASTSERVHAWLLRSTGPAAQLNLFDHTLPGVAGKLRVRIRARSLGATATANFHWEGNGGSASTPISLTNVWSTYEAIISTPAELIGSATNERGIVFTIPPSGAHDFYLAAVSVEEIFPAAANPDTSGAALGALETEVNQLKAALRAAGIIAP